MYSTPFCLKAPLYSISEFSPFLHSCYKLYIIFLLRQLFCKIITVTEGPSNVINLHYSDEPIMTN